MIEVEIWLLKRNIFHTHASSARNRVKAGENEVCKDGFS